MPRIKDVVGYEGLYQVSDDGVVYSTARKCTRGGPRRQSANKVSGHKFVGLCKGGVQTSRTVHSLVLEAFVGPAPGGHECRHLDGNPANNRLDNLACGTRAENTADRVLHGVASRGERHGNARLTEADVLVIRASPRTGRVIAQEYGVTESHVSMIRSGKHWGWL